MNTRLSIGIKVATAAASLLLATPLMLAQQPSTPPSSPDGQNAPQGQYSGPQAGPHGPREGRGLHGQPGRGDQAKDGQDGMREDIFGDDSDELSDVDFNAMELPPGDWWKRPGLAKRLSLSPDQIKRLDDLWLQSRLQEVQMHAQMEEQELRLEPILSAPTVDTAKAQAALDKLAETHAALEKAQARTMLSIRAVLTPDQWTKLHAPRPWMQHRMDDMQEPPQAQ